MPPRWRYSAIGVDLRKRSRRQGGIMLSTDELAQVMATVQEAIRNELPRSRDGMVVPGSYYPADAAVSVLYCDTAVVVDDDPQTQPSFESHVHASRFGGQGGRAAPRSPETIAVIAG
jgi:hypothetical protein